MIHGRQKGNSMELFKAHRQWATRPADQRFESIKALYDACKGYHSTASEKNGVQIKDLRVENVDGEVRLVGRAGIPAGLTHWSFGQLSARVGAPASYLRTLGPTLACQNLNHGLAQRVLDAGDDVNLLFHQNGSMLLRAITGEKYARIWNFEIAERLLDLEAQGWEPARPDIRVQMGDFPALYASDHDMFAFMRSANSIREAGTDSPMWRGVIVENSEVGASALKLTRFFYREMCGNHIIWGASKVVEFSVRHVGSAREKWTTFAVQAQRWLDESANEDERRIAESKTRMIAGTKEDVLDAIFGKRAVGLSRKTLAAGYDACKEEEDGDPRTVWGIVQGLTRHSQTTPYADERTRIDRAAGKIMEANF